MDWHAVAGVAAGTLQIFSIVPYIKDMLHGETRPNVVSWTLWLLMMTIIAAAQFSAGASWSIMIPVISIINICIVLALCLKGYGHRMYGPVDAVCFIFAIIAIVLWFVTNDPVLAIVMSVIADCIATIPTYVKTYREPFSESTASWLVCIIASGFALISASPFNVANIIFPTYMVIAGVVFLYVMMIRRHTVRPRASQT